jgi:adenylyltransferase/sulfurtransferase
MPKILIPAPLRRFTGNAAEVAVHAATVGEALQLLASVHPELRQQIFTDEGKIRSFVNVYHNDEDIRFLEKESTVTTDGDVVTLVPSIAGGAL